MTPPSMTAARYDVLDDGHFMGDDDDGDAYALVDILEEFQMDFVVCGSRADVASSQRRILGSLARARQCRRAASDRLRAGTDSWTLCR